MRLQSVKKVIYTHIGPTNATDSMCDLKKKNAFLQLL